MYSGCIIPSVEVSSCTKVVLYLEGADISGINHVSQFPVGPQWSGSFPGFGLATSSSLSSLANLLK